MSDEEQSVEIDPGNIPIATSSLNSPAIYVDAIRGASVMGEVCKLPLVENRVDALEGNLKAIHIGTLVMPTSQIRAWGVFFMKLADEIGLPKASELVSDEQ